MARANLKEIKAKIDTVPDAPPEAIDRQRLTVNVPVDVIERARNAAYWEPDQTLAGMVEAGLEHVIQRLQKKRGEPYPARRGELKRGRPIR